MRTRRSIMCEECKLPRRTKQWFDVCDVCVRNLPKVRCAACARSVVKLQPDSPLCRACAGRLSKLIIVCERCGRADYPFIGDPGLCRKCHRNSLHRLLTWQAINEALPKLSKRGRVRTKFIRSGLLELGNLFLQERLLPDWNSFLCEQRLDKYLKSAPPMFVEHVAAFERWASDGMLNPKLNISLHESQPLTNTTEAILETVKAVVVFLDWCVKRNICSLANINQRTVATYKETLFWQQECRACRKRIPLDVDNTSETCGNEECQAIKSYVKIRSWLVGQLVAS